MTNTAPFSISEVVCAIVRLASLARKEGWNCSALTYCLGHREGENNKAAIATEVGVGLDALSDHMTPEDWHWAIVTADDLLAADAAVGA